MNKRQKKKFIKKNMTELRKIHPNEGDIVVLQWNPDSEYIDFDTIVEFYKAWIKAGLTLPESEKEELMRMSQLRE